MSSDGFFDDIDEPELVLENFGEELETPLNLPESGTYDAFNEDTFGAPLEGDWESEHDKLLILENENGFDGTLTKFDDFDDKFNGSEEELEGGGKFSQNIQNINNKHSGAYNEDVRMNSNLNSFKNGPDINLLGNQNMMNNVNFAQLAQAANFDPKNQNQNININEMQMKLFQQLQLQQQQQQLANFQQQQQFQKNQQGLLQQQQKQNSQYGNSSSSNNSASISPHFFQNNSGNISQNQQLNSAMLAALMARNPQMQNNMSQNNMYNSINQNNQNSLPNLDRKTPINFQNNQNFNENNLMNSNSNMNFGNKNSNMNSEVNNLLGNMKNMPNSNSMNSMNSNEENSQKIKSFLEKMSMMSNNNQTSTNSLPQNFDNNSNFQGQKESVLKSNMAENNRNANNPLSMLSMLQQQPQSQSQSNQGLPKIPPTKVKTLEEIENELLSPPNKTSNSVQGQQNSKNEMLKNLSNLSSSSSQNNISNYSNANTNNNNLNKFFPMLNKSNNNSEINKGINENDQNSNNNTHFLMQKQKQLLEQLSMNQKQQQFQQQQQNSMLNNVQQPNDMQQHQLMLMQQQIMSSQMNLNAFLPPNFQSLNQQQKQLVLSGIQRNLQLSIMQQQQMMQNNQGNNSNNNNRLLNDMENQLMGNNNNLNDLNNNNRYNDNMKQRNNNMQNNNMNNRMFNNNQNNNQNQNRQNKNKQNSRNNSTNGDKLTGMMTDKEKNWVTNVQMLQLQIDDPYRYDFYYTAWMLKKKQFSQKNSSGAGLKTSVIQSLDNKYTKDPKTYRPLIFENSLGKVTMSNFHHPRALIDVKSGDDQSDSDLTGQISDLELDDKTIDKEKNIDTILLEIEKMYQVLLNIDEIEHSILKANDEMRAILFQDRRAKVDKLALMLCTENFAHYLFVDKGKRLLSKCIPTFNLSQTKLILGFIMQYIYIIAKNNISLDELYSHISYAIDTQKFSDLVDIVNQFVHLYARQSTQLYHTIFSNKFCLSFLLKFFSKSDLISQDDFEPDQKNTWSCFLNLVLVGLTVVQPISKKMDNIGNVYNVNEICQLNLQTALENFDIDQGIWSKNEVKLKELFTCV